MSELPVPREKVARRLKRVAGQIRGCARMVEQEEQCADILTQMAAARAALSAAAALVLTNYTHLCLEKERQTGESPYDSLTMAFALWATGPSDAPAHESGQGKGGKMAGEKANKKGSRVKPRTGG